MAELKRPKLIQELSEKWKNFYVKNSYLKSIQIAEDSEQLRGIKNSELVFDFPLTVLCGKNGSGKSTFLALSVLAFHAEQTPQLISNKNLYYDFNYFFPATLKDKHGAGIHIVYKYFDDSSFDVNKGKDRWMRYKTKGNLPRRKVRGTEFIGISRILPAFEKKGYTTYFKKKAKVPEKENTGALLRYMTDIVGKTYDSLSELRHTDSTGAHILHGYGEHSSFNAGAGEECLMYILTTLLTCPIGSIVAIEEIEIGLHPATLRKLIDVIMNIIIERKLQVVITSHSPEFLRVCPKESLVLINRTVDEVCFTKQPNVEYAVCTLGGEHKKVANIICEDHVAETLISTSLPRKVRKLVKIVAYGGKDELIKRAEIIRKLDGKTNVIIIWDGDVSNRYLKDGKEKGFCATNLPGGVDPEQYIYKQLESGKIKDLFCDEYGLDIEEITALLQKIKIEITKNNHNLIYTIAEYIEENEEDVLNSLAKMILSCSKNDFQQLVEEITNVVGSC